MSEKGSAVSSFIRISLKLYHLKSDCSPISSLNNGEFSLRSDSFSLIESLRLELGSELQFSGHENFCFAFGTRRRERRRPPPPQEAQHKGQKHKRENQKKTHLRTKRVKTNSTKTPKKNKQNYKLKLSDSKSRIFKRKHRQT